MKTEYIICINGIPLVPPLPTLSSVHNALYIRADNANGFDPKSLPSDRTLSRHLGQKHTNRKTVYAQAIKSQYGETLVLTITKFNTL